MIVLPALTAPVDLRIPDAWTVWVWGAAQYARKDDLIVAIDADGKGWRFDPVRGEWIARMRKTA